MSCDWAHKSPDGERGKEDTPEATTFDNAPDGEAQSTGPYKVYKRRFFGLAQLILLNIVVSWDVREPTTPEDAILVLRLTPLLHE